MRIAVLNSGDPYNKKGVMNFVWEKVRRLKQNSSKDEVDYFILRGKSSFFNTLLLKCSGREVVSNQNYKENCILIDGISIRVLWWKNTVVDQIRLKLLERTPLPKRYLDAFSKILSEYDIIVSHTPTTHCLAYYTYKKYGIPYSTTWHGSDINILPFQDKKIVPLLAKVISEAKVNYFVSKALLSKSDYITKEGYKVLYYTGPSEMFYRYSIGKRDELKTIFQCQGKSIVAFVGNIIDIKNVLRLPLIFNKVRDKYGENILFWLIGNGDLENQLESQLMSFNLPYRFWGMIEPNKIPDFMNCIDVLVLPSKNEGLPLVLLEALACGASVVASNVGGIPEVAGEENVFELNDLFEERISNRIVELLKSDDPPKPLPSFFSWEHSIEQELKLYREN